MSRLFNNNNANYLGLATDAPALDIVGTALTISAWISPNAWPANTFIASKRASGGGTGQQYSFEMNSGKLTCIQGQAGVSVDSCSGVTSVPGNVWNHGAYRKNGTGLNAIQAWLNGVVDGSGTSNRGMENRAETFKIGRSDVVTAGTGFPGRIAEVAVWNLALTDDELRALAKGASPLMFQKANLMGYWPIFGHASPEPDLSGNNNHMTVTGSVPQGDHAPVSPFAAVAA